MKKIDLHIHTKATISDSNFEFSLEKLDEYIKELKIDVIAITNHNHFDKSQFDNIVKWVDVAVLPGIEINLENGHLLLISDNTNLDDFTDKAKKVEDLIQKPENFISSSNLQEIFGDLKEYLLIPHYEKKPKIDKNILDELSEFIFSGEVSSPKKFIYSKKNENSLVPVLFSDLRLSDDMKKDFPTRQTFVNVEDANFSNIKLALMDKGKVFLSKSKEDNLFQAFAGGVEISTGLNLVLGKRSSGKTIILNKIYNSYEDVKYIRQFELLEKEDKNSENNFKKDLEKKRSDIAERYLQEFKVVVGDIYSLDMLEENNKIERFVDSLLSSASEIERKDAYSKSTLYLESKYDVIENKKLKSLIKNILEIIDNNEEKDILEKYITKEQLKKLLNELINKYQILEEEKLKKEWVNILIENIQQELKSHTSAQQIEDVSFKDLLINKEKNKRFNRVANGVKQNYSENHGSIGRFNSIIKFEKYNNATGIKNRIQKKISFTSAFEEYNNPFNFLQKLKETSLNNVDYYKCFVNIEYKVLNEYGLEVSGGERSEFNLLEKITDAYNYDLLLIDEPESSFDNIFLKDDINKKIKELAESIPVVISTHNSTVGALIQPNFVLYAERDIVDESPVFDVFSGVFPGKKLKSYKSNKEINSREVLLTCLEAGEKAYKDKNKIYENITN